MNKIFIEIGIINSYFDLEDYDNPIKTYIQDGLEFFTLNGTTNNVRLYFQENDSQRQDDYFSVYPQPKEQKYTRLVKFDNSLSYGETNILKVSFLKSNQKQSIERSVFTILDLFGLLGGIFEVFSISAGLLVAIFSDRLLNYTILSNLYHVDTTKWQKDHKNKFSNINQIGLSSNLDHNRFQEQKSSECNENYEVENNGERLAISSIHTERINYKDSLINKARINIKNRRLYNYKASDVCYNLLCWCKLKRI